MAKVSSNNLRQITRNNISQENSSQKSCHHISLKFLKCLSSRGEVRLGEMRLAIFKNDF